MISILIIEPHMIIKAIRISRYVNHNITFVVYPMLKYIPKDIARNAFLYSCFQLSDSRGKFFFAIARDCKSVKVSISSFGSRHQLNFKSSPTTRCSNLNL